METKVSEYLWWSWRTKDLIRKRGRSREFLSVEVIRINILANELIRVFSILTNHVLNLNQVFWRNYLYNIVDWTEHIIQALISPLCSLLFSPLCFISIFRLYFRHVPFIWIKIKSIIYRKWHCRRAYQFFLRYMILIQLETDTPLENVAVPLVVSLNRRCA